MQQSQLMTDTNEQLFLRVVEAGSLKAAAEQINADPSAVSRKIAALEDRLGVKLLLRSTKRSVPTEAGATYYAAMRHLLEQQAAVEARIAGTVDTPTGTLRVAAPVDFGAEFVAPVLADLQATAPDLKVELLLGSAFADLSAQGIDVAIRIGRLPDSSLIARRLGAVSRVIVASRSYIEAHGAPQSPAELGNHPFIFYRPEQINRQVSLRRSGQEFRATMTGHFCANSISVIRQQVAAGRGLHLGPRWAFDAGLQDGSLVAILPDYALDAFPLHAIYIATSYVPAKIRAFVDRMAGSVKNSASLSETA